MKEQDEIRDSIKPYLNSINALAKKWDVEPAYLSRWYNGMPVGQIILNKIKKGVKDLEK